MTGNPVHEDDRTLSEAGPKVDRLRSTGLYVEVRERALGKLFAGQDRFHLPALGQSGRGR